MDLRGQCPAADVLQGADGDAVVVCGVMRRHFDLIDSILGGAERGVAMTLRTDPSTILGLCCGDDLPVLGKDQVRAHVAEFGVTRQSYTVCPIWHADRELGWAMEKRHDAIEEGTFDPQDDPAVPSLRDLILGRASIEEWAETYAGDLPRWTAEDEAVFAGEREF